MNNLLRTLTESHVRPGNDLKQLLTAVKETRRQCYDTKLSDAFYESLDNLLADLRTITIDNRDAEAFLKPVSRQEVPDYYDYITQPMDLATMARKVKNKQYKSKREFKDDLDLIWSNCYKYNAAEDHPLRQCVDRLKLKAERLLKYITDRKDRTDPSIPFELAPPQPGIARPKLNGVSSHQRTPSINGKPLQLPPQKKLPFAESAAIIRTGEGMATFRELDRGLGEGSVDAQQRLRSLVPHLQPTEDDSDTMDGATGDKRKLNGVVDGRPRKRARFASLPDDLSQLWWHAVQTDSILGNGLPELPHASSSHRKPKKRKPKEPAPNPKSMLNLMNTNIKTMRRLRQTHNKLAAVVSSVTNPDDPEGEAGLGTSIPDHQLPATEDEATEDKLDERHWVDRVQAGGRLDVGEDSAHDCLGWMSGKVLEHSGFQGTSKGALEVLTSVASDYLLNVGRTLRFMSDKYGKSMTPEEIILHTLFESGVSKVHELERFISDDVERYGARLSEMEKKLVGVYRDVTAGHEVLEDEGLFEEEDEEEAGALAIGDFADGLGEDYLGLRALGIADEFGLQNLSIPKSLLRRKKLQKAAAAKPVEKPLDYPLPPPFHPFTYSQAESQIGLLKPYYQSRFQLLAASHIPPPLPPQPSQLGYPALPGPSLSMPPIPGPSLSMLPGPSLNPLPGPSLPTLPGPSLPSKPQQPYPPVPYPTPSTGSTPTPTPSASQAPPPPPQLPPTSSILPSSTSITVHSNSTSTPSSQPPPPPPLPTTIPPNLPLPDDPIHPLQVKMGPLGQIANKASVGGPPAKKKAKLSNDDAGGPGGRGASHAPGDPGRSSIPPPIGISGGGSATFIPAFMGPNGTYVPAGPDGGLSPGIITSLPSSAAASTSGGAGTGKKKKAGTGAGPGRKKKVQPQPGMPGGGVPMPISAAPSQASSSAGGFSGHGQGGNGGNGGNNGGGWPSVVIASA
ncbi:SAGA complex protein [Coprinopsis sp. MPI-PUGE-AT-0042]|nr:SAGA complex protein [Coprinopsis sp. MPI-PUGE-AT-0042]